MSSVKSILGTQFPLEGLKDSQPCVMIYFLIDHTCDWCNTSMQAATNPLSDYPEQLKILLGNQKFKVLCPNGQLKSKQGTECKLQFCHYFWHLNRCVWHFMSKQVEGDSFNLICRKYVTKRECCKVLQAIFQQHQILGSKVGYDLAINLQCQVAPWGYLLKKKIVKAC